ncbi:MAG: Hsp20/alpha crystallin family protein [Fulvivirga sp.]
MTLVRYNPLHDFASGPFGDFIESAVRTSNGDDVDFRPAVDIFRDEKQIEIQLIVPGIKKEDFQISLEKNRLEISGERKLDDSTKTKLQKRESGYGKFQRVFTLSDDVNQERINASYADGILAIQLPLVEQKARSVIKVK